VRITLVTFYVLRAIDEGANYGSAIRTATGLKGGSVYPILDRLAGAGMVTSAREDADPHERGRPLRRYVELTDDGRDFLAAMRERFG
jgi:PadR family transcriptional regulator, regulatory protein PadR